MASLATSAAMHKHFDGPVSDPNRCGQFEPAFATMSATLSGPHPHPWPKAHSQLSKAVRCTPTPMAKRLVSRTAGPTPRRPGAPAAKWESVPQQRGYAHTYMCGKAKSGPRLDLLRRSQVHSWAYSKAVSPTPMPLQNNRARLMAGSRAKRSGPQLGPQQGGHGRFRNRAASSASGTIIGSQQVGHVRAHARCKHEWVHIRAHRKAITSTETAERQGRLARRVPQQGG